jgi:hypothetical protein
MFRFARGTTAADITPDGQTLVAVVPVREESRSVLNLNLNWAAELTGSK